MSATTLRSVNTTVVDDAVSADLYRLAATHGSLPARATIAATLSCAQDEVEEAVDVLLRDGLLEADPRNGRLRAVDPEIAAAVLAAPLEREIARRQEVITEVRRRTERFRDDYATARTERAPAPTEERFADADALSLRLTSLGDHREAIVLNPGGCAGDRLLQTVVRSLLARGVRVRLLARHCLRADLTRREPLSRIVAADGEARTVSEVPRGVIVLDDDSVIALDPETGAADLLPRARVTADLAREMFEHLWAQGVAYEADGPGYTGAADDLHCSIVRLMSQGLTDEAVAKRLGMSVRSCRRHIAALLRDLGAISRFQAGMRAASRPDLGEAGNVEAAR